MFHFIATADLLHCKATELPHPFLFKTRGVCQLYQCLHLTTQNILNGGNCSFSYLSEELPDHTAQVCCPHWCCYWDAHVSATCSLISDWRWGKGSQQGTLWWSCFYEPVSLPALLVVPERLQGSLLIYFLKWHQMMPFKTLPGANELIGQHFLSCVQGFIKLTLYSNHLLWRGPT